MPKQSKRNSQPECQGALLSKWAKERGLELARSPKKLPGASTSNCLGQRNRRLSSPSSEPFKSAQR